MAWKWTSERERAAELVADDGLSDGQIAQELGINRKTLERWRKIAEFRARVKSITEAAQKKALEYAIANQYGRIGFLNDMWLGLLRVIDARANDPAMQRAPGGNTGLFVRRLRSIRAPKGFQDVALVAQNRPSSRGKTTFCVIEEFKFDAALLRAIRRLEELAARELGQWGNDHEYTRVVAARKLTPQQVEAEVERILAKRKSRRRRVREIGDAPNNVQMSAAE